MNSTKESAEAARQKDIHEDETFFILHKRKLDIGTGDGGSPRVFLDLIPGERAKLGTAGKANRGAEKNSANADADQNERAKMSKRRAAKLHGPTLAAGREKGNRQMGFKFLTIRVSSLSRLFAQ
jgi:hypothetical protein